MTDEKLKLLVVEDDAGLQKQLKWCFDEYEVLMAATRSEAIAQLRRFEPAVVLQDLGLPPDPEGVDEGMATLREILTIAPQTKVIVVTGNHDRDNAVRAVSLGAYDFYQKLFGWEKTGDFDMGPMGMYQLFGRNGQPVGGMWTKPKDMPMPPNWLLYVNVDDVHKTAEAVKANGGQVLNGPMEVPGGDWIAQCMDPQGAAFAVHQRPAAQTE